MFLILHNPLSSNKKSRKKTKKIVRLFKRKNIPFIVRSSLKINNMHQFLDRREYITDILLLGGDGSINYFINNVDVYKIKQRIHLAKSGSGNDFLKSLLPLGSADVYIGQAKLDNDKPVKFINGCGLGFDGLVCHYVNNDDKKSKISYLINVFRSILNFNSQDIKVTVDGTENTYKRAYIASVQNGRYYGGGMKVAPSANITKDSYEVIIVHNLNKLLLQVLLLSIYPGWHRFIKKRVTILRGKNIQVDFSKPTYFQADGEVQSTIKTIRVNAIEKRRLYTFSKTTFKQLDRK
ncbi:MAG: diacylglycerol kinase family protein [Tenericutes bacterium]|jgi:diacylglycerol kinase (ATP)|nr:diacylglycerol kinase family protein [Mycoplasmatota bacterium]